MKAILICAQCGFSSTLRARFSFIKNQNDWSVCVCKNCEEVYGHLLERDGFSQ